jgi:outer membrane protein insertion porin family
VNRRGMIAAPGCGSWWSRWMAVGVVVACLGGSVVTALAAVDVRGGGWWQDRAWRRDLQFMLGEALVPPIAAGAIEDAALLLLADLRARGFGAARVTAQIERTDGTRLEFSWDASLGELLPRPLAASAVRFEVQPGVRRTYDRIEFIGLESLRRSAAEAFFHGGGYLLGGRGARAYSPEGASRGVANLEEELRRLGFREATVELVETEVDDASGRVQVRVKVEEGPQWTVASVRAVVADEALQSAVPEPAWPRGARSVWSRWWQEDAQRAVRNAWAQRGWVDVRAEAAAVPLAQETTPRGELLQPVDVTVVVEPGERVRVGEVELRGLERTREAGLRRRVRLESGEWFDALELERSRRRLARMGAFSSVRATMDPPEGPERDAVFTFVERTPLEVHALLGWGTYEQLRGGLEVAQRNVWGRAHQSRILLAQSLKSTRGDWTYAMPELFGESVDVSVRLAGLMREEVTFERREWGTDVGLRRRFARWSLDVEARYAYERLRTVGLDQSADVLGLPAANVGSLNLSLGHDRRDNPLLPQRGHRVFGRLEWAAPELGGSVHYQRMESGVSWHRSVGRRTWLHLGAGHGSIVDWGGAASDEPLNKLFYPGGENSVRGYREGEAAPRGTDGRLLGARTYSVLNVEVEQAVARSLAVVVFFDTIGVAADLADWPWSETLSSAGLGLRYRSLVGPVRFEYGRNLQRRAGDPAGTWHFAIGFPF